MRRVLRGYQKAALRYARTVDHPAFFIEMRLGKTLITIRDIKRRADIKRILIVAPYSAFGGWIRELELEREPSPVELTGTWMQRSAAIHQMSKWYITNKESWLVRGFARFLYEPPFSWDAIILDESTFLANPKAKISRFYADHFRSNVRRYILTGTPAPESELNYYQQMKFLNPDVLGYDNFWEFRHACFKQCGFSYEIRKRKKHWLEQRLADHCFFLTRKDAGVGGAKIYEQRNIEMPRKIRKIYDTLEAEFLLEYKGEVLKSTTIAPVKFLLMRRLLGGFLDNQKKMVFKAKAKEILSLLEGEIAGKQVVIWCDFVNEILALKKLISKKHSVRAIYGAVDKMKRRTICKEFNAGKFQIIIAQPVTSKHGVDFSAASIAIYYSSPLGLETRLQSEDRIINTANNDSALIIDLVTENSIEEDIVISLAAKEGRQDLMRRIVRRLQNEKVADRASKKARSKP